MLNGVFAIGVLNGVFAFGVLNNEFGCGVLKMIVQANTFDYQWRGVSVVQATI